MWFVGMLVGAVIGGIGNGGGIVIGGVVGLILGGVIGNKLKQSQACARLVTAPGWASAAAICSSTHWLEF